MHLKAIIQNTLRDFSSQFSQFLTFYIVYSIAIALLLVPGAIWLMNMFVVATGNAALSDYALINFILSPIGIITVAIIGAVVLAFAFARDTGTMLIEFGEVVDRPVGFRRAFIVMLHRLWSILLLAAQVFIIVLVLAVPFLLLGYGIYKVMLPGDINYYLSYKPPEFRQALIVIGIVLLAFLIILAYLYVTWSFMLSALLFREKRGRAALGASRQLVNGRFFKIATLRVGWLILSFGATFVIHTIYWRIGQAVFEVLATDMTRLLLVSASLIVLNVVLFAVMNFLRTTLTTLFILHLYEAVVTEKGVGIGNVAELDSAETHTQWHIPRVVYAIAVIGVIVAVVVVALGLQNTVPTKSDAEIIAHRGGAIAAPENTLAAIKQGILDGTDVIEIDVQETKDGVVIVLHDADIRRVTGVEKNIWDVTYDEIKDLDAGSWFDPAFADEHIPTLEQVLDIVGDQAIILIELKYYGHDQALAQKVVAMVEERGIEDQVRIMSLLYSGIQEVQQLNPDLETGLLAIVTAGDITSLDVDFLAMSNMDVGRDFVDEAHAKGIEVAVWTINDQADMVHFIDVGVDSLITDAPSTVQVVSGNLANLTPTQRAMLQAHQFFGFGRVTESGDQ
jgi:glycerophosphoryl diester phosphodiesterase